jgi:hypothetical protein
MMHCGDRCGTKCEPRSTALGDLFDERDEFIAPIALRAGEANELTGARQYETALGRTGDRDAATTTELEHALVAQLVERTENGVRIYAEHGREVLCWWKPVSWFRLACGDRPADLRGDLFVERCVG